MERLGPGDPQHIGGYRLLARLGAGGMGHVYLARSDRGRTVAVKLVRPELAARDEFRARFRQEVRNAQRVGGFWTAPVLDADTEAAVPWVATGYVAGPSLQQVVGHDYGPLPERSVRILAAGLAHALGNIHAAGIVHRDLKPSNVMVTIEGPRVIDFGVARALEGVGGGGGEGGGLTRAGGVVGSPGFMAPEQVRGGQVTPAGDVFCLGAVLAYAATGVPPFGAEASGAHAQMYRIAEEEPDLSGLPEGLAGLVRACLGKDPAARPTPARVLELSGAHDTVSDGRSRDPWLPGALVAQLGRHAARLLEVEGPEGWGAAGGTEGRQGRPWYEERPGGAGPQGERGPQGYGGRPAYEAVPEHSMPPDAFPAMPVTQVTQVTPVVPGGPGGPAGPVGAGPVHPAYGGAQQHPQPGYGYPPPPQPPPPYDPYQGAYGPVDPGPEPEDGRRSGRSTALLVVIALVVALAAGGSLYAFLSGDGDESTSAGASEQSDAVSSGTASSRPSSTSSASTSPSPSPSATDGVVPAGYLGTWTTEFDTDGARNTRRLTIEQGAVGDAVLALVADGDGYHCEFSATLTERPDGEGPLEIGPSKVTTGEPRSSCSPGEATEVTLLDDGTLRRTNPTTGEKLTYSRG